MTELDIELTRLLWSKELSLGCLVRNKIGGVPERVVSVEKDASEKFLRVFTERSKFVGYAYYPRNEEDTDFEIIGHRAVPSDFYGWLERNAFTFSQGLDVLEIRAFKSFGCYSSGETALAFDPGKRNLDGQKEETKAKIVEIVNFFNG